MSALDAATVVARLMQFTAAAVLGGGALFFLYGVTPDQRANWPWRLIRLATGAGAIGTLGWLGAVTAQISDVATDALDPAKVLSIAADVSFGRVALVRLALFLLGFALTATAWRGRGQWLALAALGMAASASFAWTGHGAGDEGWRGALHASADVLHMLAASIWIGALVALAAFAVIGGGRKPATAAGRDVLAGLVRFSAIGVGVVAVLVASGLVNSWFLIGPDGLDRVLTTAYGRLLLAKLGLFGLMLALAAGNRFRLTPLLERALQAGGGPTSFRPVIASILTETALAFAILGLVSWMGTLSPPING